MPTKTKRFHNPRFRSTGSTFPPRCSVCLVCLASLPVVPLTGWMHLPASMSGASVAARSEELRRHRRRFRHHRHAGHPHGGHAFAGQGRHQPPSARQRRAERAFAGDRGDREKEVNLGEDNAEDASPFARFVSPLISQAISQAIDCETEPISANDWPKRCLALADWFIGKLGGKTSLRYFNLMKALGMALMLVSVYWTVSASICDIRYDYAPSRAMANYAKTIIWISTGGCPDGPVSSRRPTPRQASPN